MATQQLEFRFPDSPSIEDVPLVPARMVNEFVYCPRLAYLMWSQQEWIDSHDTQEGKRVHNRADQPKPLPSPEEVEAESKEIISRSVTLSSDALGVIAKIDIAESSHGIVTPIDYKKGKRPHVSKRGYEPERVQVCLQALLLQHNGYQVEEGMIYYAGSKERVPVILSDDLIQSTLAAVRNLRNTVAEARIPPPLEDSPKCPRCALVSVCLPDEISSLHGSDLSPRSIAVPADDALPLILQSQRVRVSKRGETLTIEEEEKERVVVRLNEISDVGLFGQCNITTPALTALLEREIPVTFHSHGGWFRGVAHGLGHKNVEIRTEQYRKSFDDQFKVRFSRDLIDAKIFNQRTIIRRNWRGDESDRKAILNRLNRVRKLLTRADDLDTLRGYEGDAATVYFRAFDKLLTPPAKMADFHFDRRNRRPPLDPVNALLSLAYAMLTRNIHVALMTVGFDAYRGFFHSPRYGRPALALDLMEPFRSIIADSVVLTVINTGEISSQHFVSGATGTALTDAGRRIFIRAFERRLTQDTTHQIFDYRLSMRRLIILQMRLLSRFLLGELSNYPHYLPR